MAELDPNIYRNFMSNVQDQQTNQIQQRLLRGQVQNTRQQNELLRNQVEQGEMDLALKRAERINSYLTPLLLSKGGVSSAALEKTAAQMMSDEYLKGRFPVNDVITYLNETKNLDDDARYQSVLGLAQQTATLIGKGKDYQPSIAFQNLGDVLQPVDVNPLTNRNVTGSAPRIGAPPTTVYTDPNTGEPYVIVPDRNAPNPLRGQAQQNDMGTGTGGIAPPPSPEEIAQSLPDTAGIPVDGMPPDYTEIASEPSAPAGTKMMPTGLSPEEQEARTVKGKVAGEMAAELARTAQNVPDRKAVLQNMEMALSQAETGPLAGDFNKIAATLNQIAPFNIENPVKVASLEEFSKLGAQLAAAQLQQLGGTGTDEKLGNALKSNPNEYLSTLGNKTILKLLKGNEDAIAVMNNEWEKAQQSGTKVSQFQAWRNEFNKKYDPRVFQSVYMSGSELEKMVSEMNTSELKKFQRQYDYAAERGWIPAEIE